MGVVLNPPHRPHNAFVDKPAMTPAERARQQAVANALAKKIDAYWGEEERRRGQMGPSQFLAAAIDAICALCVRSTNYELKPGEHRALAEELSTVVFETISQRKAYT